MPVIASLVIAFSTYSRIPMPRVEWTDENRKYTLCFFPLIGLVIGSLMLGWLWLCDWLKIGPVLRGAIGAVLPLLVTGGIHLDGLMDTCDALASWQGRERRLEILKDSHTGAFAVIGCCIYLLLFAAILSEADHVSGFLMPMAFILSRALSACALTIFKSARPKGMLDGFRSAANKKMVIISTILYLLLCTIVWAFLQLWLGMICLAAAVLSLVYYRYMAYKQFGGVTGDLAGWFVQVTELILMAAIVMGGKFL